MSAAKSDHSQRLILCLVADEEAIERFPAVVRYLQVGLIDEPVKVILVVPEHNRASTLISGPTSVLSYSKMSWPFRHWTVRTLISKVQQKIDSIQHDATVIVHGLALTTAPLAAAIATATGGELVLNVSSAAMMDDLDLMRWLDHASALVTPVEAIREAIKTSPLAAKSAEVIPLGVVSEDAPAAFNEPQNTPTVVYAGALTADAGLDTLLLATRHVLQKRAGLQLFILGKGPAESQLRHMAESLNIGLNVTFTGRLEHLRAAMRAADVFCLPHALPVFREELIHAMALGLVVIAARGSFCDDLIDRQTALLFPERDEIELARRIDDLLDQPELARTIAATGQARARSHHSVSKMVAGFLRLYRQLGSRHETLPIAAHTR